MSDFVAVDASVAFKWLVEEENSDKATALTRLWDDEGTQPMAPPIMPFEVANALHRRVVRGDLVLGVAKELVQDLFSLGVVLHQTPSLHMRALELASQLNQGVAYDAHYLALAESLDCEMWTADQRLYRVAGTGFDHVRWLGNFTAPQSWKMGTMCAVNTRKCRSQDGAGGPVKDRQYVSTSNYSPRGL